MTTPAEFRLNLVRLCRAQESAARAWEEAHAAKVPYTYVGAIGVRPARKTRFMPEA